MTERQLRTIGILGGMSDQATAEYYRRINAAVNARLGGWNTAELLVSSVNFGRIEHCVRNGLWDEAGHYLAGKAAGLERAGAELLLCVSNTMHRVAAAFTAGRAMPFLHIVDPTGAAIERAGLRRVALLGTRPVMEADYLRQRYRERFGLDLLVPDAEERRMIDRVIFDELVRGEIRPRSRDAYLAVMARLQREGAEGVILGCTEICLLVAQADKPDCPMFDTTALHVKAAVALAFGEDQRLATTTR